MEDAFARAGVHSAEALRELGTDAAYARLLSSGHKPHFIAYYVLEMALQGRPWNDCRGDEKAQLRGRFDQLKAQNVPQTNVIDAILDELGVIPAKRKAI
jgi:hypothetical protein